MNDNSAAASLFITVLVVAVGFLNCFWGYRLLKLTLGIFGFLIGVTAGWNMGVSFAPGNSVVVGLLAIVAGLIGAVLCVWLFFLGIFLLGASAGATVALAFFGASGSPPQSIIILVVAVVFGVVALLVQKVMIIISTAFSGSYLITSSVCAVLVGAQNPLLSGQVPFHFPGGNGLALVAWLVLGIAGMVVQFRNGPKKPKPEH
jgi:hypothetical protein